MKLWLSITLAATALVMTGAAATSPKLRPMAELAGKAAISAASAEFTRPDVR